MMKNKKTHPHIFAAKYKIADRFLLFTFCLLLFTFLTACQPNQAILNSKPQTNVSPNNSAPQISTYERDLKTMQTAKFDYIYVLRRKDGGQINSDDGEYIKLNTPTQTNRFIKTDEEKAVIAGSSFRFTDVNLKALRDRFEIQDFSNPNVVNANSNANSGVNSNK